MFLGFLLFCRAIGKPLVLILAPSLLASILLRGSGSIMMRRRGRRLVLGRFGGRLGGRRGEFVGVVRKILWESGVGGSGGMSPVKAHETEY